MEHQLLPSFLLLHHLLQIVACFSSIYPATDAPPQLGFHGSPFGRMAGLRHGGYTPGHHGPSPASTTTVMPDRSCSELMNSVAGGHGEIRHLSLRLRGSELLLADCTYGRTQNFLLVIVLMS